MPSQSRHARPWDAGKNEQDGTSAAGDRSRPPRPRSLHRYGQNHLVDANILRAIVEQAAVRTDDVVLEVGAADGQLTRPLLARADLVHAFEIDHRYIARLERLATEHENLRPHAGDVLKYDLTTLDPPPTALVANLAYNIAIPLIMTSIARLPSVIRWSVMVQKELGDRLFAEPSTKAYSAVSVLAQIACTLEKVRPVPPAAFRPQPRVDSSFVSFRRRGAAMGEAALTIAEYVAMDKLVRPAFAQRRKVLTNTLPGVARAEVPLTREDVRSALEAFGLAPAARPEELSPAQWVAFARELDWLPERS
ncbi:MAG TPA: 16S rRNA (adenine(1518)-N(6)/adenine(1519)-N(6))-dimethyltransferase RsmA [Thermoleophilia bacterium]|nr:16S rRNA (adenine(1518)-N(6)/adenine(1519)-N(6))-dimethyltransferase RsmA [Thermoleophilia bacterium]